MSIVVSNVRGPDAPLFMAGARLVNFAPVSIPFDGLGLNVTGFSYNGMLWICATACRDMMPDPGVFADCLRANFTALATAAQRAASHKEMPKVAANAMRASNDRRTEQRKSRRRTARTTRAQRADSLAWQKRNDDAGCQRRERLAPLRKRGSSVVVFRILTTVVGGHAD